VEREELQALPEHVQQYIHSLENKVDSLTEELRLALHRKFGRSIEKIDPSQKDLFEEDTPSKDEYSEEEQVIVPTHRRSKAGRKPLDSSIPREEIIHDIPEEEKNSGPFKPTAIRHMKQHSMAMMISSMLAVWLHYTCPAEVCRGRQGVEEGRKCPDRG
jgi:hypothetical protein